MNIICIKVILYLATMGFCILLSTLLFVSVEMPWLNTEKFVVSWITNSSKKKLKTNPALKNGSWNNLWSFLILEYNFNIIITLYQNPSKFCSWSYSECPKGPGWNLMLLLPLQILDHGNEGLLVLEELVLLSS